MPAAPSAGAAAPAAGANPLASNFLGVACVVWLGALGVLLFYGDFPDALLGAGWGAAIYVFGYTNLKNGRIQPAKTTALVSVILALFSLIFWLSLHNYIFASWDILIAATLGYTYSKL